MHDLAITGRCFNSMTNSVAKIEVKANTIVQLILNYHLALNLTRMFNQRSLHAPECYLQNHLAPRQRVHSSDPQSSHTLDNLTHSFNHSLFSECFKDKRVNQNPIWLGKVPTVFLANGLLTPVFPPIEESTWAVKLVGI